MTDNSSFYNRVAKAAKQYEVANTVSIQKQREKQREFEAESEAKVQERVALLAKKKALQPKLTGLMRASAKEIGPNLPLARADGIIRQHAGASYVAGRSLLERVGFRKASVTVPNYEPLGLWVVSTKVTATSSWDESRSQAAGSITTYGGIIIDSKGGLRNLIYSADDYDDSNVRTAFVRTALRAGRVSLQGEVSNEDLLPISTTDLEAMEGSSPQVLSIWHDRLLKLLDIDHYEQTHTQTTGHRALQTNVNLKNIMAGYQKQRELGN